MGTGPGGHHTNRHRDCRGYRTETGAACPDRTTWARRSWQVRCGRSSWSRPIVRGPVGDEKRMALCHELATSNGPISGSAASRRWPSDSSSSTRWSGWLHGNTPCAAKPPAMRRSLTRRDLAPGLRPAAARTRCVAGPMSVAAAGALVVLDPQTEDHHASRTRRAIRGRGAPRRRRDHGCRRRDRSPAAEREATVRGPAPRTWCLTPAVTTLLADARRPARTRNEGAGDQLRPVPRRPPHEHVRVDAGYRDRPPLSAWRRATALVSPGRPRVRRSRSIGHRSGPEPLGAGERDRRRAGEGRRPVREKSARSRERSACGRGGLAPSRE